MTSLPDSARSGDRLATLQALRDTLADQIAETDSGRDMAALSRQLTDVLKQIVDIAPEKKAGDPVDEIAARRAARRSGPAASASRASKVSG